MHQEMYSNGYRDGQQAQAALVSDLADALQAMIGAANSFRAKWGIQSVEPAAARAIERAEAALSKVGV